MVSRLQPLVPPDGCDNLAFNRLERSPRMPVFDARITATDERLQELEKLRLDLIFKGMRRTDDNLNEVPGILTEEEIQQVRDAGFQVEVVGDMTEEARQRRAEVSRVNRFAALTSVED